MNKKTKILIVIFILIIIISVGLTFYFRETCVDGSEQCKGKPQVTSEKIDCSKLDEHQCRKQPSCIAFGSSIRTYLVTGEEKEDFLFEGCVNRVPQYENCKEVVRMPLMSGGSKFKEECRCCCGEGPFCKEQPYPAEQSF